MDQRSFIILSGALIVLLAAILIGLLLYVRRVKKHASPDRSIAARDKSGDRHNYLRFVYDIYRHTPILKRYFVKTREKVAIMFPASEFDIQKQTSKILFRSFLAGIAGIVLTLILAKSDIFFLCVGVLITFVVINESITSSLSRLDSNFMMQMTQGLTAVRHHFYQTKNVAYALRMAVDDVPYEMGLHLQNMHEIITKSSVSAAVDKYVGTEPNRYMLLFLSVCASTKEFGDTEEEDGSSHFISQIDYLKEEVENEIMEDQRRHDAFEGLTAMSLGPIALVKPLETWARTNMEEIGQYYEGVYGIVSMVVIAVICFITYMLISYMKEGNTVIEKHEDVFSRLLAAAGDYDKGDIVAGTNVKFITKLKRRGLVLLNSIDAFLQKVINQNYTKYVKYDDDLRGMGDHTGVKAFLFKRYFIAAVVIVAGILLFGTADMVQKNIYLHSWDREFQDSFVTDEDYRKIMRDTSEMYVASNINHGVKNSTEVSDELQSVYGIEATQADAMSKVIVERISKYNNTYFKFWYLLVIMALAFLGYMFPVWVLKFRQGMIEMRKNDELVQFQSIMLILMNTPGVSLPMILEWMERFAYVFKESITRCRININHGHQVALQAMKDEQTYAPFKEFIDALMEIDNVGVTKAFDEIKSDREYYKKQREQTNRRNLSKKAGRAKMIVFVPIFTTLILYLIGPMMMYALDMIKQFQAVTESGILFIPGLTEQAEQLKNRLKVHRHRAIEHNDTLGSQQPRPIKGRDLVCNIEPSLVDKQ